MSAAGEANAPRVRLGQGAKAAADPLPRDAASILEAALAAVAPAPLVRTWLADHPIPGDAPVTVLAMGKAACGMAWGAAEALGPRMAGGMVIAPDPGTVPSAPGVGDDAPTSLTLRRAGHPLPTEAGVAAAREAAALLTNLQESDVCLVLISGGASSLAALPAPGLGLADYRTTTDLLLRAGAPIQELNAVRKHMDALKGGRAAALAAPARVVVLLISDVPGDDPAVIASGPFAPDPTTFADAVAVLRERGLLARVPAAVRQHLEAGTRGEVEETPAPGAPAFARVETRIVASNALALRAAAGRATTLGYTVRIADRTLAGEAREAGADFVDELDGLVGPRVCLLAGGETTVTVRGPGRGGRNQEFALAAALALAGRDSPLVAALGTDGVDGPTDAAGALADGGTVARGRAAGVDATDALAANDAYAFFATEGGLIHTGRTGTNVMDVVVGLSER